MHEHQEGVDHDMFSEGMLLVPYRMSAGGTS